MKKNVIKKGIQIIILGCIVLGSIRYKAEIFNIINLCEETIDTTLFYAIVFSLGALIGIFICWLIAHSLDKKNGNVTGQTLAELHPRLNMVIAVFILVIMIVCAWTVVYYVFTYMARILSDLIDWMSSVASKLDAVVIVALITGAVSIVGVIIS